MTTVTPQQTGLSSGLTQSKTSLANNFDTFLTLLTAQLQAQDPLNPMDTTEFTQQLVQYSGVEQQIRTNESLEQLTALGRSSAGAAAVGYLGRTAVAETDGAALGETGASWTYTLPRAAETVKLTIRDERGRAVFSTKGLGANGENTFTWNGKDGSGRALGKGVYRLGIEAKDAKDIKIDATMQRTGPVTQIDLSGATPILVLDGVPVPMEKIKQLKSTETLNS